MRPSDSLFSLYCTWSGDTVSNTRPFIHIARPKTSRVHSRWSTEVTTKCACVLQMASPLRVKRKADAEPNEIAEKNALAPASSREPDVEQDQRTQRGRLLWAWHLKQQRDALENRFINQVLSSFLEVSRSVYHCLTVVHFAPTVQRLGILRFATSFPCSPCVL